VDLLMMNLVAIVYGLAFIMAGVAHFRESDKFVEIVPSILPFPLFLVYISGGMEIAGGMAIIYPETRVLGSRFLALFLVGVYPANLYMWTHDVGFNGSKFSTQAHILRLIAQLLLIVIALFLSGDLNFTETSG
tara:strand:- start:1849 stop:2247 length:399 start_codon:yes stop_codon:yes gene_type:complete